MVTGSASSSTSEAPSDISQELSAFKALTTDEKLGLLWVVYDNMGGSITPAAPRAAGPQFTEDLFNTVKGMEEADQMAFMRDLVENKKTEHTEAYSAFEGDNKLVFWYQLSEGMAAGDVIPVPDDYEMSGAASQVFNQITALDFNQQITLLRYCVIDMGA
ncbi:orange carotenoid protein N-terminal domain-containing protein [cf. Phormidesmis sp. LEGE 11477]|uniref:orange carotenoid protein N-terminal domain-containing protein n=1 Tax=cf. Phormidesmis sp. LEGE 11477 TaxID=1828680 RepID=UPI00188307F0|nr:orange carotenoid protein N-terminal domain-containing protein [cf. Phormidesmis sp. LEGE 11477]MBE9061516.1 Orange carotenoid protein [cf. Phormidesmis sp. LEGE 11477]